ncbi:hypothetical protein HIM_01771 [Hirsutella minnesotensis 3608]|nr:hypothetical protein HIM_01771 [Hirsutella minnesotensis 3608]
MAPETPRGVSSRLLTMKFMQRAAASASSAGTPESEGSSKKRRIDRSPVPGKINAHIDHAIIKAALDEQEATRQAALEIHTSTDTHWTLDNVVTADKTASTPLNVVYVGYADLDSSNESGDNEEAPSKGRTSSRVEKTAAQKKHQKKNESENDDSDSQSSDGSKGASRKRKHKHDSGHLESPLSQTRSRSQSRSGAGQESIKAKEFRDKRKKKEVRLNKITSISAGGGDSSFGARRASGGGKAECYNCHQVGHRAADCPKRSKRGSGRSA